MQGRLFYDDVKDAATCAISECGKSPKEVAIDMRPELKGDSAKAWLHNCLDPDKHDKFSIDQIITFINMTKREDGTNALLEHICDETGHERPHAKEPDDAKAELQRAFIQSVEAQKKILDKLGRI